MVGIVATGGVEVVLAGAGIVLAGSGEVLDGANLESSSPPIDPLGLNSVGWYWLVVRTDWPAVFLNGSS